MTTHSLSVPSSPRLVCVVDTRTGATDKACALASALALPFLRASAAGGCLQLIPARDALELYDPSDGARLRVEFSRAELSRYRAGGAGANPLRRAIGPAPRHVVDATAGLGRDAVHLAVLGYRVTAIERNAVVSALALDGLARARDAGLLAAESPRWITADAHTLLPSFTDAPDTIYLDPMFPPKRKRSAAVRKEMRLLRELSGDDEDAGRLLTAARQTAADRVVVKRPIDAPAVAPDRRAFYRGKLVRYDVYAPTRSP